MTYTATFSINGNTVATTQDTDRNCLLAWLRNQGEAWAKNVESIAYNGSDGLNYSWAGWSRVNGKTEVARFNVN